MEATIDLFAAPAPGPVSAARIGRALHPTVASTGLHPSGGAPKTRAQLREELLAANVATVRFDAEAGELTRISQFQPAGNQCIGLYPGPLVAIGGAMLRELQLDSGLVEWDVESDQPRCAFAPANECEPDGDAEGPRA